MWCLVGGALRKQDWLTETLVLQCTKLEPSPQTEQETVTTVPGNSLIAYICSQPNYAKKNPSVG